MREGGGEDIPLGRVLPAHNFLISKETLTIRKRAANTTCKYESIFQNYKQSYYAKTFCNQSQTGIAGVKNSATHYDCFLLLAHVKRCSVKFFQSSSQKTIIKNVSIIEIYQ